MIFLGILFILFKPFAIIQPGYRGIVLQLGSIKRVAGEGITFIVPMIQNVIHFDIRIKKLETRASAASKDLQTVESVIAVNYHVTENVVSDIYKKVGVNYSETLISPAVQECVKAITAKYTAEELITKRRQVSDEISELLTSRLKIYGIIIDAFSVVNFDFSQKFNAAVEEKLAAEQQALKAQRDLERIKIEAEQKVAQAQAEAEALRIQRQQVTNELLRLREIEVQMKAVEKWNGILPTVTGNAMPFIQLPRQ